jgi:hypothetical protein
MDKQLLYDEKVLSMWTTGLFRVLALIFMVLLVICIQSEGSTALCAFLSFMFVFFLFYSINYMSLLIQISEDALRLKFGIFSWKIPLDNIKTCRLDDLPVLMRYGGAGIHFMFIRGRYRASYNFLEYPRVVIELKRKIGIIQDVSFTTRHPEDVIHILEEAILPLP